jgi:hypothetical protein
MPSFLPSPEFANALPIGIRVSRCAQLGCYRADHGISADAVRANAHAVRFSMLQGYLQAQPALCYAPINPNAIHKRIGTRGELEDFFKGISGPGEAPSAVYMENVFRQMVASAVLQPEYYRNTIARRAVAKGGIYGPIVARFMVGALGELRMRPQDTHGAFTSELEASLWLGRLESLTRESATLLDKMPDTNAGFWDVIARICELMVLQRNSRIYQELQEGLTTQLLRLPAETPVADVLVVSRYNWKGQDLDVLGEVRHLRHLLRLE